MSLRRPRIPSLLILRFFIWHEGNHMGKIWIFGYAHECDRLAPLHFLIAWLKLVLNR